MSTFQGVAPGGGGCQTLAQAAPASWVQQIASVVNKLLQGKMNAVIPVTLTANSTTTVVTDARISGSSSVYLQPLTADAAAAQGGSPWVLVTSQLAGTLTLTHANDANADKTFNMLVIG